MFSARQITGRIFNRYVHKIIEIGTSSKRALIYTLIMVIGRIHTRYLKVNTSAIDIVEFLVLQLLLLNSSKLILIHHTFLKRFKYFSPFLFKKRTRFFVVFAIPVSSLEMKEEEKKKKNSNLSISDNFNNLLLLLHVFPTCKLMVE